MTTRTKIILGILGAATVGAIIGLLTAPENGQMTRKRIRNTTGKWVDNMGRIFTRTKKQVQDSARELHNPVV
ncbi:MAG TPA: YtxH domain-containing protein [Chitinophagaceae bacterium]|nr:YtxH domain-containing protein [Chitinophagaceae bacterium]